MSGINSTVFKEASDGKRRNTDAVTSVLEKYDFCRKDSHKNVFESRDFEKNILVIIEDSKVILHMAYAHKIKENALERASRRLLEMNAEHGFLLGLDPSDGEICFDYTFMLSASSLSEKAFEDVFTRYLQMTDACSAVLQREMRPYFPGLLDEDNEPEDILHRLQRIRGHLNRDDEENIPLDEEDSIESDSDDIDLSRLIDMFQVDDDDDED